MSDPVRATNRGIDARPVSIPVDVADPTVAKAEGTITLPLWVHWSGAERAFDLDERGDRARVYEIVLVEGRDEDVRFFIRIDDLIELWDELVLPSRVRRRWHEWFVTNRGLDLAC